MFGRFVYGPRYKYPHMTGQEKEIWERFMNLNPGFFVTVDYDWRVGQGMDVPFPVEDNILRMAKMLSQKRIDVVGWNDDKPTIVEVKRRVGIQTLGQVLGYQVLFERDFPNIIKPKLMVVCEIIESDDQDILTKYKIPVYRVLNAERRLLFRDYGFHRSPGLR